KVINTEKAKLEDVLKNEEITTIIHTIGAGVGTDFKLADYQYDKIIIITNADTDRAHIQVKILTLFYRYTTLIVVAGKNYIYLLKENVKMKKSSMLVMTMRWKKQ